ncbi:MAG: sodium:solute symporter [Candidatus Kapaibacterium sp.]|nr:MAG: sodium:solute symporter [Candidatus Kapabacteria bacterium]
MQLLDWLVLLSTLSFVVLWSIRRTYLAKRINTSSGDTMQDYVLSGREAKWYTVAISVMATQASAITFISLPGQAYTDGMRFVQSYFGLPLAMVILSITAIPMYRKLNVLTAYEFLGKRFDLKTRGLAALLFLTQRSLAASISIYAPSIVLALLLGWNVHYVIFVIGALVIIYTTLGGTRAVSWAQSYQMAIISLGMVSVGFLVVFSLPQDISFGDALSIAAISGKLNTVDFTFDLNNKYTFWSGLLGGLFLQLSYFGTDQSQVQRYLSGESTTQSRLGLLFNGMMKIPMQFGILLIGVLLFVFYQFTAPPIFFNTAELQKIQHHSASGQQLSALQGLYSQHHAERTQQYRAYLLAKEHHDTIAQTQAQERLSASNAKITSLRTSALQLLKNNGANTNDTNYIFLTFVMQHLPVGLVGLLIAVVFSASMSSASSEMNALASTTVIDVYHNIFQGAITESRSVAMTQLATVFWGAMIVLFAQFMGSLGSLIEAVNTVGSLFYGAILGMFCVAFYFKRIGGTAVFIAALATEGIIFTLYNTTSIGFLWYNLIGCVCVVVLAEGIQQGIRLWGQK